jgi:glycosyltransferase involved in cell wall biosynthesis
MHIAFLTFEYVTESTFDGGLANYLYRTALALAGRNHRVEVFTEAMVDETIEHDGILVHRIKPPDTVVNSIRRIIRYTYSQDAVKIIPFALKFRGRVMHRHREQPFDIIQAANLQSLGLGLVHFSTIPLIVRASSYQPYWRQYDRVTPYCFSQSTQLIDRIERYMVRHSTAVYAPSELIANAFRQHVRADVDVIRPPFILDNITPDISVYQENLTGFRYLLFFGTLKVLKGGMILGDALKLLLAHFPDLHMVLVGKDAMIKDDTIKQQRSVLQYIYDQAGEHADRIHHFSKLRHEQLYPIIEGAVGVVLPSRIDNFPNTCLEAMALGQVVIGTRGASFDEIIEDGVSGILVPAEDAAGLVDAITRLWHMDEPQRIQIGEAAKVRIKLLEPDSVCSALEKYFLNCINT